MKRYLLPVCVLFLMIASLPARAQLSSYIFTVSSGTTAPTNGATVFCNGTAGSRWSNKNRTSGVMNIGFTFNFAGINYTSFSLSANGLVALGGSVTSSAGNSLTGAGTYPVLCPYWDDIYMGGGRNGSCLHPAITYGLQGSAPNRMLVVEWKEQNALQVYGTNTSLTFQLRLYETSNKIEFYYGKMNPCGECGGGCYSTSATIGIATSGSSFMSVTPTSGTSATASTISVNDYYSLYPTPISVGTVYTFTPCTLNLTGRTGPNDGGTAAMGNGDTFFGNFVTQLGAQAVYKPFTVRLSDASCNRTYTMSITGPNAADYYFGSPGIQTKNTPITGNRIDTVGITFKPLGTGIRSATLTVTDGGGFVRSYNLAARAPLVNYTGILPQGGTTLMASGDTLLNGFPVPRFTTQSFTPFSLTNVSPTSQTITYTLTDPTNQYSITAGTSLGAGATTTPTITFSPTKFGPQPATLLVNAGGETRTFVLYAISAAPGGDLRLIVNNSSTLIDSTSTFFTNVSGCAGEQSNVLAIKMVNLGFNDFTITSASFYQSDTTYGQGRPRYPLLRDAQGKLVPITDYILTTSPPVLPLTAGQLASLPISVPQGQSRTIYLSFISSRVGKRFARAVLRTNGQSSSGYDTSGVLTEGIVSFDVFGRGVGSMLSDNATGGLPKTVTFPETKVGDSSDAVLHLYNPGVCALRISLPRMNLTAGDVDEFMVVSMPTAGIDPATGDVVLQSGSRDSVRLRFKPQQNGSRRAGMRLMTNDSTILIPGITERGVYYVDLYGTGKVDLYADGADFGVALIGGTATDQIHRIVRLKNTTSKPVTITGVAIQGTDAADYKEDPTSRWPRMPITINAGQELLLGVVFGPAGGQPGARTAGVKITLSNGDVVTAPLTGIAGTRTVVVSPMQVNVLVSAGKLVRRTVTITNSGTMPVTLQAPSLSAGSDFNLGSLPRLVLAPGQSEYLELTYAPQTSGASNATLTFGSDATTGPVQVNLAGVALKAKQVDVDPSQSALQGTDGGSLGVAKNPDLDNEEIVSGVTGEESAHGMTLRQSVPNPSRDGVSIAYWLASENDVRLELFDGSGRLVKVLDAGHRPAGEQRVTADLRDLPSGTYHYRLSTGAGSLVKTLTIAR